MGFFLYVVVLLLGFFVVLVFGVFVIVAVGWFCFVCFVLLGIFCSLEVFLKIKIIDLPIAEAILNYTDLEIKLSCLEKAKQSNFRLKRLF